MNANQSAYHPTEVQLSPKIAERISRGVPGYRLRPSPDGSYQSWTGLPVHVDPHNARPINPVERTGLSGLGACSFWGPNHSVDPIVTRTSTKSSIEVLLIRRGDTGELALPGGKLDINETVWDAASRELAEETGIHLVFEDANEVYRGYVNDPRNTDNAWFETTALHLHLNPADGAAQTPQIGSDAAAVGWFTVTGPLIEACYADHGRYIAVAVSASGLWSEST